MQTQRILTFWSLDPAAGLDAVKSRKRGPRPQIKRGSHEEDRERPVNADTRRAIDDFLALLGHVRHLCNCDFAFKVGIIDWLDEVKSVVHSVVEAIDNGQIVVGSATYDLNEEIGSLEGALENRWETNWAKARFMESCPDSCGIELLELLIGFWADQISERGYALHSILIGSASPFSAAEALQNLAQLNYPPR